MNEDGLTVDVFVEYAKEVKQKGASEAGPVELPPASGSAGHRGHGGAESDPPSRGGAASGEPHSIPEGTQERRGRGTTMAVGEATIATGRADDALARPCPETGDTQSAGKASACDGRGFLDRRPPYFDEKVWEGLTRVQQDAALEAWKRCNPGESAKLDQEYLAWC